MSEAMDARVASDRRLVLPKAISLALGLTDPGVVVMTPEDGDIRLTSVAAKIKPAPIV
jgi:hypothetical protein